MNDEITVHDVNLALTERLGSAEMLFEAQRWHARSWQVGGEEGERPGGVASGLMLAISMLTGIPENDVRNAVVVAWRAGAFVREAYEEEVEHYAAAWGISLEEARTFIHSRQ